MTARARARRDRPEREIEAALDPGEFISDRPSYSFVSDLELVDAEIASLVGSEPARRWRCMRRSWRGAMRRPRSWTIRAAASARSSASCSAAGSRRARPPAPLRRTRRSVCLGGSRRIHTASASGSRRIWRGCSTRPGSPRSCSRSETDSTLRVHATRRAHRVSITNVAVGRACCECCIVSRRTSARTLRSRSRPG